MNHFLARLGRLKYAKHFVPAVNCLVTGTYFSSQFLFRDQIRDLFAAQTPSGRRERISDNLRDLITETYEECIKNGLHEKVDIPHLSKLVNLPDPPTKWFVSSTLEPILFGCTKMRSGILCGLPSFYNYNKPEDIPDSTFEVKKLALFRSAHDEAQEERSKIEEERLVVDEAEKSGVTIVRKIDRNADEGRQFAESLILSDNAKRFSIARELFLGDSFCPLLRTAAVFLSCSLGLALPQAAVKKFNLKQSHLSHRQPYYLLGFLIAYGSHRLFSKAINQAFAEQADKKAKAMGAIYESGAEEYYSKRARRNHILGINQ